jgi:hypothetical protein
MEKERMIMKTIQSECENGTSCSPIGSHPISSETEWNTFPRLTPTELLYLAESSPTYFGVVDEKLPSGFLGELLSLWQAAGRPDLESLQGAALFSTLAKPLPLTASFPQDS